ncbi:hypothetical protein ACHAW6_000913 [Cyclotella cf. meneghiniana]
MKPLQHTNNQSLTWVSHTNSSHQMTTVKMSPKNPSKHGKTTSLQYLATQQTNLPYTYGRQLKLLWQSNANPKLSAYAHLYGLHNYNAIPFVPLGMEALVHDTPIRCKTYAQHCSKGWVIGTSTKHYTCWKIWSTNTCTTRIAETVFFKHKYLTNPFMSPADALIATAANLAHLIKQYVKEQHVAATKLQDLQRLQRILHNTAMQHIDIPLQPQQACAHAALPRVPKPTTYPSIPLVSDDDDRDM